jgi:hypothetical protein
LFVVFYFFFVISTGIGCCWLGVALSKHGSTRVVWLSWPSGAEVFVCAR